MSRSIALLSGAMLSLSAGTAVAQQNAAAEVGLEEVVVTAERRTENLQKVPVTVTAVSEEQLVASGVTNIQQLSALVPSLSVVDPTGYNMAFIRGIGSTTLGGGTYSSTAIYVDGAYIARTTNAMFELDNIENIQVLAGPQGALYGRNATAGAIVITSRKPKPGSEFTGNVSASLGNYNQRDLSGALFGGLGDKWGISFTAAKHLRDGYVNNLNPSSFTHSEDMDDRDAVNGAMQIVYEPNDRMSFAFRAAYAKSEDRSGGGYVAVGQNVPGPFPGFSDNRSVFYAAIFGGFCPTPAACPFGPALTDTIASEVATNVVLAPGFRDTYDNQRSGFQNGVLNGKSKPGSNLYIENTLLTLNASFEFDNFTLRSVTAHTNSDYHGSVQVGLERPGSMISPTLNAILGAPAGTALDATGGLGFSSQNPDRFVSQGFQFLSNEGSRINWIGGIEYSTEEGKVRQAGDALGNSPIGTDDKFTVDSGAVYAQATIPFADRWSATVGGRYTDETYEVVDFLGTQPVKTLDGNKFTYTARLQYQADEWLAYGGVTTGFKTGTLNAATTGAGDADPEKVQSIEVGLKRNFANRYRINAAAYFSTYEDVQLQVIDQFTGGNILDNGPKAEVTGLDLQADARITDNFQVSVGATVLDPKFVENSANLPTIKGNKLPGASDFVGSLVTDWKFPLASGASVNFTTTTQYNSGKWYDHLNLVGSGGATDKSFTTVGFNLAYKSSNEKWTASLWGNNIFDEEYYRTGIIAFGTFGRAAIPGNPANYGATIKVSF